MVLFLILTAKTKKNAGGDTTLENTTQMSHIGLLASALLREAFSVASNMNMD